MNTEYQAQVEKKLKLITEEMEKIYDMMERYSESNISSQLIEAHRKFFIGVITAYTRYVEELKRGYGGSMTELPRPENPSSKYGGNS